MPADGVRIPTESIRRHAGSVDAVADAVEQARSAVGAVSMDTQAYGQLCQFLPALLAPVFDIALVALNDTGGALRDTAADLRATAAGADSTDEASSRKISAAGGCGRPRIELPL